MYKETRPELKLKVFAVAEAFWGNIGHVFYSNKILVVFNCRVSVNVALAIKLTRRKWGFFLFWCFMAGARQLVGPFVNRVGLPGGIIKAGHLSQAKLGENKVAFLTIMASLTCFVDAVREEI